MSVRQPSITPGLPHINITVTPTGDPEIDAGVEAFLRRQSGVDSVTVQRGSGTCVVYAIGLELTSKVGEVVVGLLVGLKTYYMSYGMEPNMNFVDGRL